MRRVLLVALMICAPSLLAQKPETTAAERTQPLARVSSSFAFTVNAAMHDAAPLFGPERERVWAGEDWDPQFVFPVPAQDVEGAVFTIRHGDHTAVWVNIVFDLRGGHMQYVYVLSDLLVTTIDVRLHAMDSAHTRVDVTYVRTALAPEANEHVAAMGKHDREQGPIWQGKINTYLQQRGRRR